MLEGQLAGKPTEEHPRILILDDDEDILAYLRAVLGPKYAVSTLTDGREIEATVAQLRPNLLVLDYKMPRRNGLEICRALRADPANDIMPILFLTAIDNEELRLQGYAAGADDFIGKPFEEAELKAKLDVWVRLARRSAELVSRNRDLAELALKDDLTNLASRRYILEVLERELAVGLRYRRPVAVVMLDIDDFKNINDTYGHQAGDEALRLVADCLRANLREADVPARYGGDEFLLVLPNSDITAAETVCRRLSQTVLILTPRAGVSLPLSLSLGAAAVCTDSITLTQLIDAADLAMLIAKKSGKGRYHINRSGVPDPGQIALLEELSATRDSVRETVCRLIGALVAEMEREGDIYSSRLEIMLGLGKRMAERLKLPPDERLTLQNAIRVANCGKLGISAELDSLRGGLTPELREVVQETLRRNVQRLRDTEFLVREAEALLAIHERFDGTGFPHGLSGAAIPRVAQLLSLLSTYALLREGGLHTNRHDHQEAWTIVQRERGTHFDPALVDLLGVILKEYYADDHDRGEGEILVVDDHQFLAAVLMRRLAWAGYGVTHAASGAEAREAFAAGQNWRAVLLDVMLPDASGLDLCAEFRQSPQGREAPILVMSCRGDAATAARAQTAGATAYVIKPISFESLLKLLATTPRHVPPAKGLPVIKH